MKDVSKKGKLAFASLLLLFGLLISSFSSGPVIDCQCSSPEVTKTSQTSNSVSYSWNTVSGATGYRVWYYRVEDNYTSEVTSTGSTSIEYSNLTSGTYRFHFRTSCGGEASQIIIADEIAM